VRPLDGVEFGLQLCDARQLNVLLGPHLLQISRETVNEFGESLAGPYQVVVVRARTRRGSWGHAAVEHQNAGAQHESFCGEVREWKPYALAVGRLVDRLDADSEKCGAGDPD